MVYVIMISQKNYVKNVGEYVSDSRVRKYLKGNIYKFEYMSKAYHK